MDRESKKLVCPECHSEDYIVFSEQEIQKRISITWVIITSISFIVFVFLGIGSFFTDESIKKPTDFTDLRIVFFWIACIITPLLLTIIGIGVQTILYYLPITQTKFICKNCNKINNFANIEELLIKRIQGGD